MGKSYALLVSILLMVFAVSAGHYYFFYSALPASTHIAAGSTQSQAAR